MEWNVYYYNINRNKIETFNIFNHYSLVKYIQKSIQECEDKDEFAEKVKSELQYYFWSKCEWEVIITDWPTHISIDEFDRIKSEIQKYENWRGHKPYSTGVNLPVAEKIDVYDQVKLNWSAFVDYTWHTLKAKALVDTLRDEKE